MFILPSVLFMKYNLISQKLWQISLPIAIVSAGLFVPAVQAATTEVLLRRGAVLPGDPNRRPVESIGDFAIDAQQNIVVDVNNQTVFTKTPQGDDESKGFKGIYQFSANQAVQLVEGVQDRSLSSPYTSSRTTNRFSNLSISQGKVAYLRELTSVAEFSGVEELFLMFGPPGQVSKIAVNAKSSTPPRLLRNAAATVNGKVFFLREAAPRNPQQSDEIVKYENGQYQTLVKFDDPAVVAGGQPPLSRFSQFNLRATSETLVLTQFGANAAGQTVTRLFELPNGGRLRKAYETTGGFCGLAASRSNIAVCIDNKIFVRRGSTGQFAPIALPQSLTLSGSLSISGEAIVFVSRDAKTGRQAIYLSRPGQATREVVAVASGELALSATGQSLNGSTLVYRYTKADNSSFELRRMRL
jgi:hypothetical protein